MAGGLLGASAFDQTGRGLKAECLRLKAEVWEASFCTRVQTRSRLSRSSSGADALGEVAVGIVKLEEDARLDGDSVGKDNEVQSAGAWGRKSKA